jgi:hypothetical protein
VRLFGGVGVQVPSWRRRVFCGGGMLTSGTSTIRHLCGGVAFSVLPAWPVWNLGAAGSWGWGAHCWVLRDQTAALRVGDFSGRAIASSNRFGFLCGTASPRGGRGGRGVG